MASKLDKSIIVAGAGLVASIFTTLVKKVREKGGTDEDIHRLSTPDGESILEEIADIITKYNRRVFKVFKTIKLGTGLKTADDFRKSIKDNRMKIDDWANDILGKPAFTVAVKETELDLVVVSVAELGFKNGATLEQIYARAKELGLDLCPNEVGPQLRLQYKDQPNREWLAVAIEPITGSDGDLGRFSVRRDGGGLWLHGCYGGPGGVWRGSSCFVFVCSRK
jgi:hypothetical protein